MRYFSLFTGIGGFELGIQQAYDNLRNQTGRTQPKAERQPDEGSELHGQDNGEQPICVGYSEIDKYAIQIYQSHFPEHKPYGDITTINADTLPDFDLLCGGFPCQAFSVAGKRRGFDDTRGTLFFDICRLAKAKRPRLLLLENVKGLLNHDGGQTFRVILTSLDELGYDCQWQVCNSKDFGVPQNRERVIIVGHLRGTPRPEVFPLGGSNSQSLETLTDNETSQGYRVYGTDGIATTLASQAGGVGAKTGLYAPTIRATQYKGGDNQTVVRQPLRYLNRNQKNYEGDYAFTVDSSQTAGVRITNPKMLNFKGSTTESPAITATSYKEPPVVNQIRRLTPTECERLQGFPDGWTSGVSDTQRYKTLGNAVTVNVIKAITQRL